MTVTNPVVEQLLSASSGASTTAAFTLVFTTTAIIPVGRVIVIANNRGATASSTCGISSIALAGGGAVSSWVRGASAVRSNTHDLSIMATVVTTAIPIGATITVTNSFTGTRRAGLLAVFTETTSKTAETTSGTTTGGDAGTSVGSNGSSSAETATASTANTGADMLVVAAFSLGGSSQPLTLGSGLTLAGEVITSVGSGDRGVTLAWRIARTAVTQSATGTQASSAVWAAALASYPISGDVSGGGPAGSVIISGAKKAIASRSVIIGGTKKTVTSVSVIIGGVKKPTA